MYVKKNNTQPIALNIFKNSKKNKQLYCVMCLLIHFSIPNVQFMKYQYYQNINR
jgi:hypothetical protein